MTHHALALAARLAPVVERVHGKNHPEMTRVRQLTEQLMATADPTRTAALFAELRAVTDNYEIPGDVCEAFEATYQSLAAADAQQAA